MAESEAHVNVAASDPLATAERWRGEGRGVAVATVITTWGSSPRPVGSQLVLDEDGRLDRRGADRRLPWAGGRGIRHGEALGDRLDVGRAEFATAPSGGSSWKNLTCS